MNKSSPPQTLPSFSKKAFLAEKEPESMNLVSYGVKVQVITGKRKKKDVLLYISESQREYLQLIRKGHVFSKDRISLSSISMIQESSPKNTYKVSFTNRHLVVIHEKFAELTLECADKA